MPCKATEGGRNRVRGSLPADEAAASSVFLLEREDAEEAGEWEGGGGRE